LHRAGSSPINGEKPRRVEGAWREDVHSSSTSFHVSDAGLGARAVIVMVLLLVAVSTPAADRVDRLYGAGDREVEELARLYRVAGEAFPTVSLPVSGAWLYEAALDLRGTPVGAGELRGRIDAYLDWLDYRPGEVRTAIGIAFQPEVYAETAYLREDITEKLRREAPALSVQIAGGLDDGPLLYTRVEAIREYGVEHPSNLTPPLSDNPIPYEFNNVYEGYFYWPFEFAELTFGRQTLDLGPAPRSSIALAPEVPYLDALRLTANLGPIRMHHAISSIDNEEARRDVALPETTDGDRSTVYDFDRTQIFFNTHYFEYRFDRWRLGVGANLVVSREMNNFNLSDFFPVFSWHNANILPRNMSAFVDATVPVAPGWEVYGQASFDDIRTTGVGIGDQPIPTIPAFTLGGRYSRFGPAVTWDVGIDAGYTHYLWGNFPIEDGLSRAIFRIRSDGGNWALPLTSPYGPGTLFGLGRVDASTGRLSIGVLYEIVGRKPDANLFTTLQEESDELAGQAYEPAHRVEIDAAWRFAEWFSVSVQPGLYATDNDIEGYVDLSVRISYSSAKTVAEVDGRDDHR
jgi:hypothetical protein